MRVIVTKFVLPLLLILFLAGATFALASSPSGGDAHGAAQIEDSADSGAYCGCL